MLGSQPWRAGEGRILAGDYLCLVSVHLWTIRREFCYAAGDVSRV